MKSKSKQILLTTLTGSNVNIDVEQHTDLTGARIASTDKNGDDNNNLKLTTNTLNVASLSNTKNSNSISGGMNVGGSLENNTASNISLNFSNINSNSKTKTLATLGNGNINITDKENSDTTMLNHDIKNIEIDIYDVESKVKLDGEIDMRMFTKKGQADILNDMKKTKVGFYDVAKDIITSDSLTILDSFSHQGNKVAFYDGVQNAIKNNTDLQEKLADSTLTKEDKNNILREIASSVAKELKIKLADVSTISTDKQTKDGDEIVGGYHKPTGDIVVNDKNIDNTGKAINTLGHELAHLLDDQRGETREGTTASGQSYSNEYAKIMGNSLEDYAEFGMYNYSDYTLATTNEHVGLKTPTDNEVFDGRVDAGEVEFDTAYSIYHDNEKKVQEIVTFKQLQQEQLANRDFEGAKATREEIARLDNDVKAFQNENGTGNQAVQNIFDEFDKIDETNVAVVETVVTIVGGRKLLKEVSNVSDDVVLSTGIKVNNTIQNKVIPAVKDGYYRGANAVLNPTLPQKTIEFVESVLPGVPATSTSGVIGFSAEKLYNYDETINQINKTLEQIDSSMDEFNGE